MAESNFNLFHSGFLSFFGGDYSTNVTPLDLNTHKLAIRLLKDTYTPDISASTSGSIGAAQTNGESDAVDKTLSNVVVTASANGNWKLDADDAVFTATSGGNLTGQYCLVHARSSSPAFVPLFLARLSTGAVVASQITVQFAAEGLYDFSASSALV